MKSPRTKQSPKTRRTEGVRQGGRALKVVTSVMAATMEELARVGYEALRMEDVAQIAGVNKTTVYRRWPTKADLVADALRQGSGDNMTVPDTGSLKGDLRAYFAHLIANSKSDRHRGILTTLHNCNDPALKPVAGELRRQATSVRVHIVQRGIDQGELPASANAQLIADLVSAPILRHLLTFREEVSLPYVDAVLNIVLRGAGATAKKTCARPPEITAGE